MKESDYLGGLGVDRLLKLNWILWNNDDRAWSRIIWLRLWNKSGLW
jgi:hypothetical protein